MPMFYYKCADCARSNRRLLKDDQEADLLKHFCPCGGIMVRAPQAPSARITETLDNGLMVRRLERIADAEQVHYERAHGKKGTI